MWTRAAVAIGILGRLAQILQWIETSHWVRRVLPASVRLVSEHAALLTGVVNLAIITLLVLGLLRLRQLERQQTDDDRDVLRRINALETRVWEGLKKSLTEVHEDFHTRLDGIRAEVRGQIEQRQRDLDRDFQDRIVKLERTVGARPPERNVFRTHDGREFT